MIKIYRQVFVGYLLLNVFISCTYSQKRIAFNYGNKLIEKYKSKVDTDKIDIITYEKKYSYCFQDEEPFKNRMDFPDNSIINYKLNLNDYAAIEYIANQAVNKFNNKEALEEYNRYRKYHPTTDSAKTRLSEFQINLNEYYRKYMAGIIEGKVYVKIFCYHSSKKEYFHNGELVEVDGGGKLFFQLLINLSKFKHYGIEVNAPI